MSRYLDPAAVENCLSTDRTVSKSYFPNLWVFPSFRPWDVHSVVRWVVWVVQYSLWPQYWTARSPTSFCNRPYSRPAYLFPRTTPLDCDSKKRKTLTWERMVPPISLVTYRESAFTYTGLRSMAFVQSSIAAFFASKCLWAAARLLNNIDRSFAYRFGHNSIASVYNSMAFS